MTMDINNRKAEIKADVFLSKTLEDQRTTELPVVKSKRSFDVAFLMLPDDKFKKDKMPKYSQPLMPVAQYEDVTISESHSPSTQHSDDEDEEIEVDAPKHDLLKMQTKFYTTQKQQIFGDPQIGKVKIPSSSQEKSAFTKVSLKESTNRLSPNLSISPDPSYQNSLSPSPPILVNRNYQNFPPSMMSQSLFKPSYQTQFVQIQDNFHQHQETSPFILKSPNPEMLQPAHFGKMRAVGMMPHYPTVRPELTYNYATQFQPSHQEVLKMAQQQPEMRGNPAAALLSSLLPPSLAALSLPAQNVCAKCNISFRMTSDLVYHMRSHHKNETTDYGRRKREDKLKCPVCAESFRERHHLTRHMTAHQDKDNDGDMPANKSKKFIAAFANNNKN